MPSPSTVEMSRPANRDVGASDVDAVTPVDSRPEDRLFHLFLGPIMHLHHQQFTGLELLPLPVLAI